MLDLSGNDLLLLFTAELLLELGHVSDHSHDLLSLELDLFLAGRGVISLAG